jgi:hypothetical protein
VKDTQFMSAQEKQKVLRQWDLFLKSGLARKKFTKALYDHLIQHCSFIAHYNIDGFYSEYFLKPMSTVHFLSQFDNRNGVPTSIEIGGIYWYMDERYNDINSAMCAVAAKYIPRLLEDTNRVRRERDIQTARELLAEHGLTLKV